MIRNVWIPWLVLATGCAAVGQSARSSGEHFRWSRQKAQEISYSATIRKSTEVLPQDKKTLIKVIEAELRPFKTEYHIESERELYALALKTRVKLVDLNGDGVAEILAQANDWKAGCGATGNCTFWVFQKRQGGFKKILDTRGKDGIGGFELYTVKATRTENFNDLVLADHTSASERTIYVYRYRAGAYRKSGCYFATWISTEGGGWKQLKNPQIGICPKE